MVQTLLIRRNRRVAFAATAVFCAMVGLSFASVPLYQLFCQVTGFGGAVRQVAAAPAQASTQQMQVRFDANTDPKLPWAFAPEQRVVRLAIGAQGLAFFKARNLSGAPITGRATFNVTPAIAGQYFHKIQCFCFESQRLDAGQSVDMPVSYFIDPAILADPQARQITEITLSYTFFRET